MVSEERWRVQVQLKAPLHDHADAVIVAVVENVRVAELQIRHGEAEGLPKPPVRLVQRTHPCGLKVGHGGVVPPDAPIEGLLRGGGRGAEHTGGGQRQRKDELKSIHGLNLLYMRNGRIFGDPTHTVFGVPHRGGPGHQKMMRISEIRLWL